jgi:hypothetical protein
MLYTVQRFLPRMQAGRLSCARKLWHIDESKIVRYTSYAPSKFIAIGCQNASMPEGSVIAPFVRVSISASTVTQGFEIENKTNPTKLIINSEQGGLIIRRRGQDHMILKTIVENPPFCSTFTFDAWMLTALTAGWNPSVACWISDVANCGSPLFRFISLFLCCKTGGLFGGIRE